MSKANAPDKARPEGSTASPPWPGDPRVRLASCVNELMTKSGMTQRAAAEQLRMPQPRISAIRNYRLSGISIEKLFSVLVALDQNITITVKPQRRRGSGGVDVVLTEGSAS